MMIRPLTTLDEFQRCIELQQEAFGWADVDVLPRRFMVVLNQIGGVVLGAFEGNRLAAFLNAVPGVRDGMPYWHSHMLAVGREYWNTGVGSDLKLAQREEALQRGIHLIEWTFDPLESKNAYLNVTKLGVIVRRYYPNHYGETTGALQRGMDSDRVVAEWWIDRARPSISGDIRRIVIPADLQSLKAQSLDSARDIQKRVREQFLKNLEDDYFVAGFDRGDEWSQYLFAPGASRVHQAD
jgi:predicted GNAT superfamily acetyltransferase